MKDVENKAETANLKGKDIPNLSPFNWEDPFLIEDPYIIEGMEIRLMSCLDLSPSDDEY